ncbi:MAG: phosphoserine transaminase [Maricaulaceae bacterium]|jgi:phosphoserine aminotransferase
MTDLQKPDVRPDDPRFSPGPTRKRPGWSLDALKDAAVGRSHRSKAAKAKLKQAIDETRDVLGVPADYRIAIVPASDTGAVEMAMWSLLGSRGVDVFAWENFGRDWVTDAGQQLRPLDARLHVADYGELPDLSQAQKGRDIVFTWNGTTSGVRVPNADWIPADREGLTICDATSAAFAQELDWPKLDVVTYSWQKVMGGEAAHGMLIVSPRVAEHLKTHTPPWPVPKILRLAKKGEIDEGLFEGSTINTPSMLCVEDYLDTLAWGRSIGGLEALHARADANAKLVYDWIDQSDWAGHLVADPGLRSNTSACLKFKDPAVAALPADQQTALQKKIEGLLADEKVAYDIGAYRTAPPGLRLWCGATTPIDDLGKLLPWIDWAYATAAAELEVA